MSREVRLRQQFLRQENKNYGSHLVAIPEDVWQFQVFKPKEVWRSERFLVQVFPRLDGALRMSVCRTMIGDDGRWLDGITWEDLMCLKDESGHGQDWAVEIYPPADKIVNVANMRHLWILPEAPSFAWRKQQ